MFQVEVLKRASYCDGLKCGRVRKAAPVMAPDLPVGVVVLTAEEQFAGMTWPKKRRYCPPCGREAAQKAMRGIEVALKELEK